LDFNTQKQKYKEVEDYCKSKHESEVRQAKKNYKIKSKEAMKLRQLVGYLKEQVLKMKDEGESMF